jgi:hypothetical protein
VSAVSVTSWQGSGAGYGPSAHSRPCRRIGSDDAKGRYRTATRTNTGSAETTGPTHKVEAGSTLGPWPNNGHQRIAALLRFGMKPRGSVRAARAEAGR